MKKTFLLLTFFLFITNVKAINNITINNNQILKLRIPLNKADIFKRIKNEVTKTGDIYENAVQDVIALIQFSQYIINKWY